MIKTEKVRINGREFTKTYHDKYYIKKVGTEEIYAEAYDVLDFDYELTDKLLPEKEDD